ncbi:MAG: FAD:protein FMN transferase [Oscillospiraceae bacterium]|nr:FAD:protein FMN transferase [Oscillospiraceae bacterium]
MKRLLAICLVFVLLFSGCSSKPQQYTATYLTLFDTVTTIIGYAQSEEAFRQDAQRTYEQLERFHQLFDIYNEHEGINNLKTVNDNAGIAPVAVAPDIINLLLTCKTYYDLTDGKVNAAMGSVLRLWHEARTAGLQDPETAALPDMNALAQAAEHTDFDRVIIDVQANTVYITDPEMSLDVGAIAKGWAARQAALSAPAGMLISIGGNVCITGPKQGNTPWVIGIQDPDDPNAYLHTLSLQKLGYAVATSGDYQRTYTVDDMAYHHIIDPATQMPPDLWRSVTVVCYDSGLADALSTALFLLPLEEGEALAESLGAEAFWLDANGNEFMTIGFRDYLKS